MASSAALRCFTLGCWLLLTCLLAPPVAYAEPRLAYVRDNIIYTARASDGRDERRVCPGERPCLSHDGRRLTYLHLNGPPGTNPLPTSTVVVRDLAGGAQTDLPAALGPRQDANEASWSPDDLWIACTVLTVESWQVAAVHPDGSGFHLLTDGLDGHERGYFLAGWNQHDGALLAHNGKTVVQLDPATGSVAWTRPLADLIGASTAAEGVASFTISADGRQLIYARDTDEQEIPDLGVLSMMSSCLAVADFPATGTFRRVTPKGFTVSGPCVSPDGASVYLSGVRARDIHPYRRRGIDGLDMKQRLYRYDLGTGKLTPLVFREVTYLSVSRE